MHQLSSTYEGGFGDSDLEASDSGSSDTSVQYEQPNALDYWYGKKQFECVLARSMLDDDYPSRDLMHVDARFEAMLRQFPYHNALARCKSRESTGAVLAPRAGAKSSYEQLMSYFGAVARAGTKRDEQFLVRMTTDIALGPEHAELRSSKDGSERSFRVTTSPPEQLGKYTSALYNYGREHGMSPTYECSQLSDPVGSFLAKLTFGESVFEGIDKNKKEARHKAAYAACQKLCVIVPARRPSDE